MKTELKIGVDIDEVLVNQLEKAIAFYKFKTGKYVPLDKFFSYNWWEVWGISKKEAISMASEFQSSQYFDKISLVEGAREAILKLSASYKIIFITSRPLSIKEKTKNLIQKNFPGKQFKIIFSNDFHIENSGMNKADIVKKLKIDSLIEDSSEYAFQSAEKGIKVFLLDKPWNQGIAHKNIIRVKSWKEILRKIK